MAEKGDIYLALYEDSTTQSPELLTPFGRKLSIGIIELSRKDRTANNRLVIDIINRKKKFTLNYEAIDGNELAVFEFFFLAESELILYIYRDALFWDEYVVMLMPYDKTRFVLHGNGLWSDVTFVFEEV